MVFSVRKILTPFRKNEQAFEIPNGDELINYLTVFVMLVVLVLSVISTPILSSLP